MSGREIILGVSGGIAAYKSACAGEQIGPGWELGHRGDDRRCQQVYW